MGEKLREALGGGLRSSERRRKRGFQKRAKMMRCPGFEPGSTAWKAAILTTRLTTPIRICRQFVLLFEVAGRLAARRVESKEPSKPVD